VDNTLYTEDVLIAVYVLIAVDVLIAVYLLIAVDVLTVATADNAV
jgi:hypothetical protein